MISTMRTFLALAWRNIWRNPRRTVITLIVVSTGLWSVLFFNSFMVAWMTSSKEATLSLLLGEGQIHAVGYMDDPNVDAVMPAPSDALKAALNVDAISAWTERVPLPGVVQSEYKTLPVTITGVDPAGEIRVSSIPGDIAEGRYLDGPDDEGVVIGLHLAERLKTEVGRRVILMSQNADGTLAEWSFDVVGLFDADKATEDFHVFTGIATTREFLGLGDRTAEIVFRVPKDETLNPTVAALKAAAPDLDVRSWREMSAFLASTDTYMAGFIFIWLGVVFSLMAIGIVNTQLMAVFERSHEFGLVRALGMKPRLVLLMVSLESALLIGVGVLIGAALAALTIWSLYDGIDLSAFAQALEMFQGGQVLYPKYDVPSFILFSLLIWGLGILVALWPARRAARLSPVEAMRHAT
jgi:ABC-type lipoprotein release transport system permease subunit